MFVLVENDSVTKTLSPSKGITIGENQYPRAIYTLWSAAEREAIGIYEVVWDNANFKDQKYYINTDQSFNFAGGVVTASYGSATAKALADVTVDGDTTPGLKTKHKENIKNQASGYLTRTDWYVVRKADAGTAVPSAITTHRAAVRTTSNDMEALIDACTTVDELVALYTYTGDPGSQTRPLGEWPEEV